MNYEQINQALQNIITRLRDAEKGYLKIAEKADDALLKQWMIKHSRKRNHMYNELLPYSSRYAEEVKVKASALGAAHRLFLDVTMSMGNSNKFYNYIYQEIERGSNELIYEYDQALKMTTLPAPLKRKLQEQKDQIQEEVRELEQLKVPA